VRHSPRAAPSSPTEAWRRRSVETDGRLPDGQELGEATEQVDGATDGAAAYFMIGSCCGTDDRHVGATCAAWLASA
jgi:homocysteine S-methyltransferase